MEPKKDFEQLSNLEKEEQSWKNHNTEYQTTLQGHCNQNSLVQAQEQTYRSVKQNRDPKSQLMPLWSINIGQMIQEHTIGSRQSLQ